MRAQAAHVNHPKAQRHSDDGLSAIASARKLRKTRQMSIIAESLHRLDAALSAMDAAVTAAVERASTTSRDTKDYARINSVLRSELAETIRDLDRLLSRGNG